MPEGHVLEFSGISKRFGAVTAVDNFTARIQPGIVTGFLGPNGAGKSTTLRMLLGLVRPTSGTATVGGVAYADLAAPARTVGAVLEATSFHPGRTAAAHLKVYAQAAQIPTSRVDEVLALVGLTEAGGRKVGGFSLGMRQRLALATALLGDPGVLVLDEPTNGLDPEGIQWIRVFLRALAAEGRTVLVSSHMLSEVEQTVDSLVMISRGRLVFQGDFNDLLADAEHSVVVDGPDRDALGAALQSAGISASLKRAGFTVAGADTVVIGAAAAASGVTLSSLNRRGPSLEDVFFELVSGQRVHSSAYGAVAPVDAPTEAVVAAPVPVPTAEEVVPASEPTDFADLFAAPVDVVPEEPAAAESGEVTNETVAITIAEQAELDAGDAQARAKSGIQLPVPTEVAASALVVAAAAVNGEAPEAPAEDTATADAPATVFAQADEQADATEKSDPAEGDDVAPAASVEDAVVEDAVVDEAPVEHAPGEDAAAVEAPVEEDAVEDAAVEDDDENPFALLFGDVLGAEDEPASDEREEEPAELSAAADAASAETEDDADVSEAGAASDDAGELVDEASADEAPVKLSSGDRPWWEPAEFSVPLSTDADPAVQAEAPAEDAAEDSEEPTAVDGEGEPEADEASASEDAEFNDDDFPVTTENPTITQAAPAAAVAPAASAAAQDDDASAEAQATDEGAGDDNDVATPEVGAADETASDDSVSEAADDDVAAEATTDDPDSVADEASMDEDASSDADTVAEDEAPADADAAPAEAPVEAEAAAEAAAPADADTDDLDDDANADTTPIATVAAPTNAPVPAATPWWLVQLDEPAASASETVPDDAATSIPVIWEIEEDVPAHPPIFHPPFGSPAAAAARAAAVAALPDDAWAPPEPAEAADHVSAEDAPVWTPPAPPVRPDDSVFEVASTGEIEIIRTGAIPVIEPDDADDAATAVLDVVDPEAAATQIIETVDPAAPSTELSFDDLLAAPDTAPRGDELLRPVSDEDRGAWERREDRTPADDAADEFFRSFGSDEGPTATDDSASAEGDKR